MAKDKKNELFKKMYDDSIRRKSKKEDIIDIIIKSPKKSGAVGLEDEADR